MSASVYSARNAWRVACRWGLLTIVALLGGCQATVNKGPIYKLPVPEEHALAAPVAVSITDSRPPAERQYQPGSIIPVEYQQGLETLTLDNFEPQLADLLKQAFAGRLSQLTPAPSWADVQVTRFRVIVDRREILAAEYERNLLADEVVPAVGVGVGLGSGRGGMGSVVGGVGAGLLAAAVATSKQHEVANHRASWNHAVPGVTCEIDLHVELHWPDQHRETFDLQAHAHSQSANIGTFTDLLNDVKWSIAPTVDKALLQLSNQLQTRAQASLAKRE